MAGDEDDILFELLSDESGTGVISAPIEFDAAVAPGVGKVLQEALQNLEIKRIILDLGRTAFIDSTGIHALLAFHGEAAEIGKPYILKNIGQQTRKVLGIAGVNDWLNIELD